MIDNATFQMSYTLHNVMDGTVIAILTLLNSEEIMMVMGSTGLPGFSVKFIEMYVIWKSRYKLGKATNH